MKISNYRARSRRFRGCGAMFVVAALLPLAAGQARAQQELIGEWSMTFDYNGRSTQAVFIFDEDDGQLSGSWLGKLGQAEIYNLQFSDGRVTFTRYFRPENEEAEYKFEGHIENTNRLIGNVLADGISISAVGVLKEGDEFVGPDAILAEEAQAELLGRLQGVAKIEANLGSGEPDPEAQARARVAAVSGLEGRLLGRLREANVQAASEEAVKIARISSGEERRQALVAVGATSVTFPAEPLGNDPKLAFGIGVSDAVWEQGGDGVEFSVSVMREGSEPVQIYSAYLDPKSRPQDRDWRDVEISLKPFAAQDIQLIFATGPGPAGDAGSDIAAWSGLVISR